jgi:hypothetical protein
VTQEDQRRDSAKGGLNPVRSALGWSGTGVSDTEEGSGPEIIDLEETLLIRTVILFCSTYVYNLLFLYSELNWKLILVLLYVTAIIKFEKH